MTDVSHQSAFATPTLAPPAGNHAGRKPWPYLPYALVFVASAGGLIAGRAMSGDAEAFESKLLLLLRFMAAIKFLGVLAAAGALHWRRTTPLDGRLAAAYLAALAVMAAAPGLIWSLGGIALGALLFHAGLLAFLYLAWKDDGVRLPSRP